MKIILALSLALLVSNLSAETYLDKAQTLINQLVKNDQLDRNKLETIFSSISKDQRVLDLMGNAPERKANWGRYSKIFLNKQRIDLGKKFLVLHKDKLTKATRKYKVPGNIIVAILGIETYYGAQTGGHKVVRSLATLAFDHPRRYKFFRNELSHFLRFTNDQNLNPLVLTGSYAGAMGYPQFMPSSYVSYAVDFDNDGDINIWEDETDAIGSIANYLEKFGWINGLPIAYKVQPKNPDIFKSLANNKRKPSFTVEQVQTSGIQTSLYPTSNNLYSMFVLNSEITEEYWLGTKNFYVISRYNPSYLYTMAVVQLAMKIEPDQKIKGNP